MPVGSDWTIFEVFIASPSELERERDAVERAIQEWNSNVGKNMRVVLVSLRWEQLAPQLKTEAQPYINQAQVERADILIAFFWNKAGKGTIKEVDLFLSMGKSRTAMVYFKTTETRAPELNKLVRRLQALGLTGKFKDSRDLTSQVKENLTSHVKDLQDYAQHNWPRLKSAVEEVQKHTPYLLARFLTNELLRTSTDEIESVRDEVRSFVKYRGYRGYRDTVHKHLQDEKLRKGTRVFAICGEKGLRDDQEALEYFQEFYAFPDLRSSKNQVFRVFVERQRGKLHRPITDKVIRAHRRAKRVVPLTVSRKKRRLIDEKFPGLCTALDEGFGLVLFVKRDNSKIAIVHQGVKQDFTFAVFDGHTNVVRHLMALTYDLYRDSNQYYSNKSLRKEIDSLMKND